MREILFRGKDADSNEWRYGYYGHCEDMHGVKADLISTGHADVQMGRLLIKCLDVKSETVGQYTGLTDKNGKKIFEGDIVSGHLDDLFPEDESRYEIAWIDYGWHLTNLDGTVDTAEQDWVNQYFEVIGNIHDNPELLEVEEHE